MSIQVKPHLLAAAGVLAITAAAQATELKEIGQIPVKLDVPLQGFDIGWVDPATDRYVLTSRSSFDPDDRSHPGNIGLLIFDSAKEKLLRIVPGFSAPRGVVTVNKGKQAYVGDADNTVRVVDRKAGKVVTAIPAGAKEGGSDELAYDPKDNVIAMALPDDHLLR